MAFYEGKMGRVERKSFIFRLSHISNSTPFEKVKDIQKEEKSSNGIHEARDREEAAWSSHKKEKSEVSTRYQINYSKKHKLF